MGGYLIYLMCHCSATDDMQYLSTKTSKTKIRRYRADPDVKWIKTETNISRTTEGEGKMRG